MAEVTTLKVSAETSIRIKERLDAESRLGDGYAIIALFEIEQALHFVPTVEYDTLRNSMYTAFAHVAMKLYVSMKPELGELDVVHDLDLCAKVIHESAYS